MARRKLNFTERELVAGCIRNERYYQEHFYRRFAPVMMRMCMRYAHDEEVALDILNRGMLKVFQKLNTFRFQGSLEGWVRRLVFHTLADYFRKENRKVHFLALEDRDDSAPADALQELYVEDIYKLVEQLPPASKEVFWLYAIEGYTHPEIAKRLSISEGTSKWHLSNARKRMKALLDNQHHNRKNYAG